MVDMSELCNSGGVINAYEAIKLASTLKPETKKEMKIKSEKEPERINREPKEYKTPTRSAGVFLCSVRG